MLSLFSLDGGCMSSCASYPRNEFGYHGSPAEGQSSFLSH